MRNSFLRPSMSANRPNSNAPTTAPAIYSDPDQPTWAAVSPNVSGRSRMLPKEPTRVTSRPSSIQAMPRASTTRQCQADHGKRSNRAGMSVYGLGRAEPGAAVIVLIQVNRDELSYATWGVGLTNSGASRAIWTIIQPKPIALRAVSTSGRRYGRAAMHASSACAFRIFL